MRVSLVVLQLMHDAKGSRIRDHCDAALNFCSFINKKSPIQFQFQFHHHLEYVCPVTIEIELVRLKRAYNDTRIIFFTFFRTRGIHNYTREWFDCKQEIFWYTLDKLQAYVQG